MEHLKSILILVFIKLNVLCCELSDVIRVQMLKSTASYVSFEYK